jgi:hypothetical protein
MPAPDLASLQAGPDTFLTWMESNLLSSSFLQNTIAPNARHWIKIEALAAGAVDDLGQNVDTFKLVNGGAGAVDSLPAFVCNYAGMAVHSSDLSTAGDFCFTPNMNGCTFAIGTPQPNGTVQVSHANSQSSVTQRAQISGAHGGLGGLKLMEPAHYRSMGPGNHQATTFGIRSGMRWRFYFQSYTYLGFANGGMSYRLNGVFPFL